MLRTRHILPAALLVAALALTSCGSGGPVAGLIGGDCPGIGKPADSGPGTATARRPPRKAR